MLRNQPGDVSASDSCPFATKYQALPWKIWMSLDTELQGIPLLQTKSCCLEWGQSTDCGAVLHSLLHIRMPLSCHNKESWRSISHILYRWRGLQKVYTKYFLMLRKQNRAMNGCLALQIVFTIQACKLLACIHHSKIWLINIVANPGHMFLLCYCLLSQLTGYRQMWCEWHIDVWVKIQTL